MTQNMEVICMIDRIWRPKEGFWDGEMVKGTLIDFSTQTAEEGFGKMISVGIVLLDDDSFVSVPLEFIYKTGQ